MFDPVSGAILGSAAIGAGGSIFAGRSGAKAQQRAAQDAAAAQLQASREAQELQREFFERSVELQEPFRQAGISALGQLLGFAAPGGLNIPTLPGAPALPGIPEEREITESAEFRSALGQLRSGLSARGQFFAGRGVRAEANLAEQVTERQVLRERARRAFEAQLGEQQFRLGLAGREAEIQNLLLPFQAQQQQLGILSGIAGFGSRAAGTLGGQAVGVGGQLAGIQQQLGGALGQSALLGGQAQAGFFGQIGSEFAGLPGLVTTGLSFNRLFPPQVTPGNTDRIISQTTNQF